MFNIITRHIVAVIQALYEKQSAIVSWNGSHAKCFFIENGTRQGSMHSISTSRMCLYGASNERVPDCSLRSGDSDNENI